MWDVRGWKFRGWRFRGWGSGWEVHGMYGDMLVRQFEAFPRGEWNDFLNTSGLRDQAATAWRREAAEPVTRRNDWLRALALTQMGVLSVHQALDVRHSQIRRGHK